ncbi:sphingomyelin phosphodiesterase-like [Photinus pyralis]|nr:sphingomyelin phosphodiesterase-like [Photinus pyralis]
MPKTLRNTMEEMEFRPMVRQRSLQGRQFEPPECALCNTLVGTIITIRRIGTPKDVIVFMFTELCITLKLVSEEECKGFINMNVDTILYIIDNRLFLTPSKVCSIVFQDLHCADPFGVEWDLKLPPYDSQVQNNLPIDTQSGSVKILQITDIHYDSHYQVGSNADCGLFICCQIGTVPSSESTAAGYWGDYRDCDVPWHSFLDLLTHVKEEHHPISYVYFTGDIVAHKVYDTSEIGCVTDITKVYTELKNTFGNVPVYPILGNHEAHPANLFAPEKVDPNLQTVWLFRLVAELWQAWLPADTQKTILKGGYYTVLVKPGFRIIALNSNVCFNFNFWLFYDDFDPYGQLQWLINTLLYAETQKEKVHILTHVPSGDYTCVRNWGRQYAKIVNRFSHVISAQFTGHTHLDDTVIYYSHENRSQANNVAFNGGSFTTYSYLNPNYKVYDVNNRGMEVANFESWMYNMTDANQNASLKPKWYKLYDFKSAYNVSSLHPQELSNLVERMTKDKKLTQLYFRYKFRDSDYFISQGCNSTCELENICTMVTAAYGSDDRCKMYTELYLKNRI